MKRNWLDKIKQLAVSIADLKRYWKVIVGFLLRVSQIDQEREAKQIENMNAYLTVVAEQLEKMKSSGVSDDEVRKLAIELKVPLIQSNLEAMIINRNMNPINHREELDPSPETEGETERQES